MLHDQAFMTTALEAFRNPTLMREHLRSSEGALRSMENVPGGFETIKGLFKKIESPSARGHTPERGSPSNTAVPWKLIVMI